MHITQNGVKCKWMNALKSGIFIHFLIILSKANFQYKDSDRIDYIFSGWIILIIYFRKYNVIIRSLIVLGTLLFILFVDFFSF